MIGKEKPKENQLLQQFDKFWGELGTKNLEELAPYTQQIKIDGNFLYYRDYLGIRDDPKIMQYLKLEKNIQKSIIQRCFSKQKLHSQNMGWLQIFKKKMFQGDWQEVFVILTNVGLVLFKKPGDAEPILFVSFVQAIVIKNPLFNTSKQNTIKIRYENCDSEFVFNATSAILLDQLHDTIQTAIVEQVKQQNQYLLYQQKQVVDHRNQTIVDQLENHNYTNKLG